MPNKQINELDPAAAVASDDDVAIWDTSESATKKATITQIQDAASPVQSVGDTDTVDLTITGTVLTADVEKKADGGILSDAAGLYLDQATTSKVGGAEIATDVEVQALVDTIRMITPSGLGSLDAGTAQKGILETATDVETQALSATDKAVTPGNLGALAASETQKGIAEIATNAETQAGSDHTRIVTPADLRSDVPATPAASRGVRLNASGDLLLPSGGDVLVEGNTDVTTGLGNLLKLVLGQLSLYENFAGNNILPSGVGWSEKTDGDWVNWADGESGAGAYKGSDDFVRDNYAGGTNQWSDVGSAAPYSLAVTEHQLVLTSKRGNDSSPTHAAIETAVTSSSNIGITAQFTRAVCNYYSSASAALDFVAAVMVGNAGLTELVAAFITVPSTVMDGGQDYHCSIAFKRYYHASTAWDPAVTTTAAWLTNWTSLRTITGIPIGPLVFYLRPYASVNYVYFGLGVGAARKINCLDYVSSTITGPFTRGIIFQSYFDQTASRTAGQWDYVRFASG